MFFYDLLRTCLPYNGHREMTSSKINTPALGVRKHHIGAMPAVPGSRAWGFFSLVVGLERLRTAVYRFCRPVHYHFATAPILAILLVTPSPVYAETTSTASWYSVEACKFNKDPKCPTASGKSLYQLEKDDVDFAASYRFPLGTRIKVTNLANNKSAIVRIYDRGPHPRLNREIDLGKKSFNKIADLKEGLIKVKLEVL